MDLDVGEEADGVELLGCLKILDLSHCHSLTRTPDFSRLPILERLILKGCETLIEVHESIGNLENSLVYLNLEDCTSLSKLPRNIAMLKVLKALIISGCLNLVEFPMGMEKLEVLRVFHVDRIVMGPVTPATEVGTSWHALIPLWRVSKPRKTPELSCASLPRFLVNVSLAGCNLFDDAFPRELTNLHSLQNLNLGDNPFLCVPTFIKGLPRLQTLRLGGCHRLQEVTDIRGLQYLDMHDCTSLQKYEPHGETFPIARCDNLMEMAYCSELIPIDDTRVSFVKYQLELINNIEMITYHSLTDTIRRGPI
ncbi:hypothetical protein RJ639_029541, partial [Escallonia herrerae]